jgi:hypothetical protein
MSDFRGEALVLRRNWTILSFLSAALAVGGLGLLLQGGLFFGFLVFWAGLVLPAALVKPEHEEDWVEALEPIAARRP